MSQPHPNGVGELEFSDLDRHFGALMMRLAHDDDPSIGLAASLASRTTTDGGVCVNIADFAPGAAADRWVAALRKASVVGAPGDFRPLILDARGRLYLYRYWDYERRLAENLLARAVDANDVDEAVLAEGLTRYFPSAEDAEQRLAAAMAVLRRFCVISGGPGTGKTTTVVKILALLAEQAPERALAIGLAAPTGKAAARVQEAVRSAIDRLQFDGLARASMPAQAYTLHRLLGTIPDSVYYRHDRENPLPLDVLVVDEASMADLALAAKLAEALPMRARLILLGDKDQLASVEAGAVLADVCAGAGVSRSFAKRLARVTAIDVSALQTAEDAASVMSDSVALLGRSYRFGPESGIGTAARLVNEGRGTDALALIKAGMHADVAWREVKPGALRSSLEHVAVASLRPYFDAVRASEPPERVFELFSRYRVLCALRRGPFGSVAVNRAIEELLEEERWIDLRETWYAGRPIMITRNDYNVQLFNGDVGVTLADPADGRLKVYFPAAQKGVRAFAPSRIPEHETVYAMTVHKSQGSEFGDVLMILPDVPSPVVSRELVYTGLTRAMKRVEIWGSEAGFIEAAGRRVVRASALHERLWAKAPA